LSSPIQVIRTKEDWVGRVGTLLIKVPGLSGVVYPVGTSVVVTGHGASVDAFVGGDWLPLQWWEFAEGLSEAL